MSAIEQTEVSLSMGLVVERRPSTHRWLRESWRPVAAYLVSGSPAADWTVLREAEGVVRYHAGTLPLTLHRSDTEPLRLNLMQEQPALFAVLRPEPGGEFPYRAHAITASPYDAQDFDDTGEDLIEKLPMPEAVAAFVQAFVELHHEDEPFRKRRRDRLDTEEQKFGKQPIFRPLREQ